MNNLHFSEQKFNAIIHAIIFQIEQIKMQMQETNNTQELEKELHRANELYNYLANRPNGFTLEQTETAYVYLFMYNNFCQHNSEFINDLQATQELLNDFKQQFDYAGIDIADFFTIHNSVESFNNAISKHKIGRNEPCPCGSGKKYKHCCGK